MGSPNSAIRKELRVWDETQGQGATKDFVDDMSGDMDKSETINNFTRLGTTDDFEMPGEAQENERDDLASVTQLRIDDLDELVKHKFLRKGDLVELE